MNEQQRLGITAAKKKVTGKNEEIVRERKTEGQKESQKAAANKQTNKQTRPSFPFGVTLGRLALSKNKNKKIEKRRTA